MIGGTIIEKVETEETYWVNVNDEGQTCGLHLKRNNISKSIEEGDSLWWQGKEAFWTSRSIGTIYDFPIERIGGSGAPRPTSHE